MPESRPGPRKASERLRRLLVAVPYIVQHPGIALDELSQLFGVDEAELVEDLNLLFVTGLPPYGPGDLIDVDITEGHVWIGMADYFARPVRLTRSEALALYLRGEALLATPGLEEAAALAGALEKIERALGPETLGSLAGAVQAGTVEDAPGVLVDLREAVEAHRQVEIEYYSAGRGETTIRSVDPEELWSELGNWYVVAWDHRSDDERLFRADRIKSARTTGVAFEPRGLSGQGRPLYTRTHADIPVRLRLGPGARWVAEYYEVSSKKETEDGRLEVVLPSKELAWMARLILRLAGEAEVMDPPELAELVRTEARAALANYTA
jgi:proteasome accessory factor C